MSIKYICDMCGKNVEKNNCLRCTFYKKGTATKMKEDSECSKDICVDCYNTKFK